LRVGEAASDLQFNARITLAVVQNQPVSNFDEMRLKAATPMAQKLFRPRKVLPSSRSLRHADECKAWCQCYKIFLPLMVRQYKPERSSLVHFFQASLIFLSKSKLNLTCL
jgi:hypothetical protein